MDSKEPLALSMEQEFKLTSLVQEAKTKTQEELVEAFATLLRQSMMKDNFFKMKVREGL